MNATQLYASFSIAVIMAASCSSVTVTGFLAEFHYQEDVDRVVIDFTHSHIRAAAILYDAQKPDNRK